MATAEQVTKAKELLRAIRAIEPMSLLENPKWGTFNFRDIEKDLTLIYQLAGHLDQLPIELVLDSPMNNIVSALTNTSASIQRVSQFDLEQGNPRDERNGRAEQIRQRSQELLNAAHGWIPYLAYQKGDIQSNILELGRAIVDARRVHDDGVAYVQTKRNEMEGIISAAKEAAASVGVGHFTANFADEALRLEDAAATWLKVTSGLAVATLVSAAVFAALGLPTDAKSAQVVHLLTSKVVVLVVLFSATIWCGRIYKATKHQAAINHHRANALKTFQAFIKATNDNGTRDAVLLETTRSIFAISPSGYLESSDGGDPSTKLLEVIRTSAKSGQ